MTATEAPAAKRGKEWLDSWNPEDEKTWDSGLAWKTLWITTFNLTLAFITWFLVSALAPKLNNIGFNLTKGQLYWLAAMPGLAGGFLRLIWTFLPPIMGTKKMVALTSASLALPLLGWGFAVQNPSTPFVVLMLLAFLAGLGGGAFSGFMPSTSYFFPKAKQGTALGLQAGIGNFGVSVVQFVTPWVVGFAMIGSAQHFATKGKPTVDVWYQNAAWFWVPFVIVGAIVAWFMLRSVPVKAKGIKQQFDIFSNKHTWLMTVLYVVTFGTFSGFAAAFGLLIKDIYGTAAFGADGKDPLKYAFLGALIGSIARVLAGPVADKVGGGRVTFVAAVGITAGCIYTAFQLNPASVSQFPKFLIGMLVIFFFTGVGNASTFKQMPMIFQPRQAGGVIGWTAAIAAFGPFLFGLALASIAPKSFFLGWSVVALIGAVIAWWYYARPKCEMPS